MATISEEFEITCEAAPVQIEGRFTDGRYYYFRSRHRQARLGVGYDSESAINAAFLGHVDQLEILHVRHDGTRTVEWGIGRDMSHVGPGNHPASGISNEHAFTLIREMSEQIPDA